MTRFLLFGEDSATTGKLNSQRGAQILLCLIAGIQLVRRIVEAGDEVAVELEWSGILAVSVVSLPAGSEMKAFVAMFLTLAMARLFRKRNYELPAV